MNRLFLLIFISIKRNFKIKKIQKLQNLFDFNIKIDFKKKILFQFFI